MKSFISILFVLSLGGCASTYHNADEQNQYDCNYVYKKNQNGKYYKYDGPLPVPSNINLIPNAVPKKEKILSGTSKPYEVFGVKYYPMSKLMKYKKNGEASWYGGMYHGRKTSSGEIYDMFKMTAASPELPIFSYAKITSLTNGRSVIVKINDRGPFLNERIIDLSFLAACRLGYVEKGLDKVTVELLNP